MTLQYITDRYVGQRNIRRHTAPKGLLYVIKGFNITSSSTKSNLFVVIPAYIEDEIDIELNPDKSIFVIDLQIDGLTHSIFFDIGHESKHFSVGPVAKSNVDVVITTYYTLKHASNADLIWEFLRRGKNP